MTTVNDFTFVTNRDCVLPAMGPVADDVPTFWEGFFDLRLIAFARLTHVVFKNTSVELFRNCRDHSPSTGDEDQC